MTPFLDDRSHRRNERRGSKDSWRAQPGPVALSLLLASLCVFAVSGCGTSQESREAPNIILVSLDTLRADRLGIYGYDRPTSPNIDVFADEAVVFDHFVSSGGGTLPVHVSMFTGLPPQVHGVTPDAEARLAESIPVAAELLSEAGYATAAFTDGGFVQRRFGFDRGFDVFDDSGGGLDQTMPKALALLQQASEPFFLFLHTYDAHSGTESLSYEAPGEFVSRFVDADYGWSFDGCREGRCASDFLVWLNEQVRQQGRSAEDLLTAEERAFVSDLYDAGIAHLDDRLGAFFASLRELGLYEESYIILLSDHGEELFEHGSVLHHQNFEEILRIPLLVKVPGGELVGRTSTLSTSPDVMPTLLEIAGVEPAKSRYGRSLLPALAGAASGHSSVVPLEGIGKVRTTRWSLLVHRGRPFKLFDLATDPFEQRDVLASQAAVASELMAEHRRMVEAFERGRKQLEDAPVRKVELPAEEIENLRALGYLQ